MNKYYTYAYLRKNNTPYYIGKGSGGRAHSKYRKTKPRDKTRILILKQNLTEDEAFRHEIYMISLFGRKDLGTGILRNRTKGGEGSSGKIFTKEYRKKLSDAAKLQDKSHLHGENNSSKRPEVKEKIRQSILNWHTNNPVSNETKQKQSAARIDKYVGPNHPSYGRKQTPEEKEKQILAQTGKKRGPYKKKTCDTITTNPQLS